jgi:hypothetical protein
MTRQGRLRSVQPGETLPATSFRPVPPGTASWRELGRQSQAIASRARDMDVPGAAELAQEAQQVAQGARRSATQTARGFTRAGRSTRASRKKGSR